MIITKVPKLSAEAPQGSTVNVCYAVTEHFDDLSNT